MATNLASRMGVDTIITTLPFKVKNISTQTSLLSVKARMLFHLFPVPQKLPRFGNIKLPLSTKEADRQTVMREEGEI